MNQISFHCFEYTKIEIDLSEVPGMDLLPSNPQQIEQLPLSYRERVHQSRRLRGTHLFLLQWSIAFKTLSHMEQESIMEELGFGAPVGDDTSIRSVSPSQHVKMSWHCWRHLDDSAKNSWNNRAAVLNLRMVPGKVL